MCEVVDVSLLKQSVSIPFVKQLSKPAVFDAEPTIVTEEIPCRVFTAIDTKTGKIIQRWAEEV